MPRYRYRHPFHCPEGGEIDWPYDGPDAEDDAAAAVADGWQDDWMDDTDVQIILDDLQIELVEDETGNRRT